MALPNLKELLAPDEVWTVAARVAVHAGEKLHYHTNEEGDIVVSLLSLKHEVPINANLGALVSRPGVGIFQVPDVGVEVLVAFDWGDFGGEAYIVGYMTSGIAPKDLDGNDLAPGIILVVASQVQVSGADKVTVTSAAEVDIIAPRVVIANGPDDGSPVATLADLQAQRTFLAGHKHTVVTAAAAGTWLSTAPTNPVSVPVLPPVPAGTMNLLAE